MVNKLKFINNPGRDLAPTGIQHKLEQYEFVNSRANHFVRISLFEIKFGLIKALNQHITWCRYSFIQLLFIQLDKRDGTNQ